MTLQKMIDGVLIDLTTQEQAERDAAAAAWDAGANDRKAAEIRAERNAKIAACDWRVIKSLESNQLQDFAWASYRQALRDVPIQPGFPGNVVWPVEP